MLCKEFSGEPDTLKVWEWRMGRNYGEVESELEFLRGSFLSMGFPCNSAVKESACNVGDLGSVPGLVNPLENSMDHIVHGVTKSRTRLSNFHFPKHGLPWWFRW